MEVIVKENYKQLNIGECLKTIEWENIPHVAQILEVIYKNPRIQHARLAEMIDISSATLTGIMKRMTDAGMVEFIRSGKFKYYHLPPVEMMDDDDYMESIQRIKVDYQKALFAINYGYAQKTQMAEQILNIATEIESSQDRIVFVANILGYYKNQIDNLENEIDQLKNQINNAEENKKNETTV